MSCQKALKTGVAFGFAFSRLRNISGVHTFLSIIVTTPSLFQIAKVKIGKKISQFHFVGLFQAFIAC